VSSRLRSRSVRAERTVVPAVATEELGKVYGDAPAVGPIDLVVPPGQALLLVGHNGSGKSTLLAMVAGLLEPSDGSVSVFGAEPGSLAARAATSYLPDTPVLYDDLSVREHLQYVSRMHGADDAADRLDGIMDRLGLLDRADDLPSQFSRGLRQRTAIAIGVCRPFGLLLVDEPVVGLDTAGRAAFAELLREAHGEGATLVVATHDPGILGWFDRVVELDDGTLTADHVPGAPSAFDGTVDEGDQAGTVDEGDQAGTVDEGDQAATTEPVPAGNQRRKGRR
jgi:ABC-2 type transport system ATP-binding protein